MLHVVVALAELQCDGTGDTGSLKLFRSRVIKPIQTQPGIVSDTVTFALARLTRRACLLSYSGASCGGADCAAAARRWTLPPLPAQNHTQASCRALCAQSAECEVWTLHVATRMCELKRRLRHAVSIDADAGAVSGPRDCNTPWLPFPELAPLRARLDPSRDPTTLELPPCSVQGHLPTNGCVSRAYGHRNMLAAAVALSWLAEEDARPLALAERALLDADACAALCDADGSACEAWAHVPLAYDEGADEAAREQQAGFYGESLCALFAQCHGERDGANMSMADARELSAPAVSGFGAHSGRCALVETQVAITSRLPNEYNQTTGECIPSLPRCRRPHTAGEFSHGTLVPKETEASEAADSEGCFYHIFTPEQVEQCMRGRWLLLSGGSNTILLFQTVVAFMAPGLLDIAKDDVATFQSTVIDVVLDGNGGAQYVHSELWDNVDMAYFGSLEEGSGEFSPEMIRGLDETLARAPPLSVRGEGLRVTLVVGQYWQNAQALLNTAVHGPRVAKSAWADAQRVFYAQIMQWYYVCATGMGLCNRRDAYRVGYEVGSSMNAGELGEFLEASLDTCQSGKVLGCFVAPNIYDPNQVGHLDGYTGEAIAAFEDFEAEKLARGISTDKVHFLNVYELGGLWSSEVSEAHVMPAISLWFLYIMLNTVCDTPATQDANGTIDAALQEQALTSPLSGMSAVPLSDWGCHQTVDFSASCTWAGASFTQCETYRDHCDDCKLWECANSRDMPCSLSVSVPAVNVHSGVIVDEECDVVQPPLVIQEKGVSGGGGDCGRFWCGSRGDGWGVAIAFAWLFLLVALGRRAHRKKASNTPPVPAEQAAPAANGGAANDNVAGDGGAKGINAVAHTPIQPMEVNLATAATVAAAPAPIAAHSISLGAVSTNNGKPMAFGVAAASADRTAVCGYGGDAAPNVPRTRADFLPAIGFARYLASLHIVVGHLDAKGELPVSYFAGWGFTWVPWFFMLSGFILCHIRLGSRQPELADGPLRSLWKRSANIYPMYAVGLILSIIARMGAGRDLPSQGVLLSQVWLTQSFVPWLPERGLQQQCWFLSCMVVYWLLFRPLYGAVRRLNLRQTLCALFLCSALPWLVVIVPYALDDENWSKYAYGDESSTALWVITLKFNPVAYLHVFVFGMCLARLRSLMAPKSASAIGKSDMYVLPADVGRPAAAIARLCSFGAAVGYAGLLVIFLVPQIRPYAHRMSARLSILMPLQGLGLLGLASRTDPLARVFCVPLLSALGDMSYVQYVLQFVVADLWPVKRPSVAFFIFLTAASQLGAWAIQAPLQRVWQRRRAFAIVFPLLTTLLVAIIAGGYTLLRAASDGGAAAPLAPAYIVYASPPPPQCAREPLCTSIGDDCCAPLGEEAKCRDGWVPVRTPEGCWFFPEGDYICCESYPHVPFEFEGTIITPDPVELASRKSAAMQTSVRGVDVRLNLTCDGCGANSTLINPTLAFIGGRLALAARAHGVYETLSNASYENRTVLLETTVWHSEIAVASVDLGDWAAFDDAIAFDPSTWALPAELRSVRLATSVDDLAAPRWEPCEPEHKYIAANDTLRGFRVTGPEDPKLLPSPGGTGDSALLIFNSLPPAELARGGSCGTPRHYAVSQMFAAPAPSVTLAAPGAALAPDGVATAAVRLTCGWTKVNEKNWIAFETDDGQLNMIYSVHPHRVVQVRPEDGACHERYGTSHTPLAQLQLARPDVRIHGSGTAIRLPSDPSGPFYALFHTIDGAGTYTTYLYRFAPRPPFAIISVSRPLPLWGDRAFASGLAAAPDGARLLVAYGNDNAESRLLVFSVADMELLFDCSDPDGRTAASPEESEDKEPAKRAAPPSAPLDERAANACNLCGPLGPFATCAADGVGEGCEVCVGTLRCYDSSDSAGDGECGRCLPPSDLAACVDCAPCVDLRNGGFLLTEGLCEACAATCVECVLDKLCYGDVLASVPNSPPPLPPAPPPSPPPPPPVEEVCDECLAEGSSCAGCGGCTDANGSFLILSFCAPCRSACAHCAEAGCYSQE